MSTDREQLIEAVAVTAELLGTEITDAAARVLVDDLSVYPLAQVLGALKRCRQEVKGKLTLSEIILRLDDGRPGPEQAWAAIPRDEADSVVWTAEMREAYRVALPLMGREDEIAARMAFKEAYTTALTKARAEQRDPKWEISLGYNHRDKQDAESGRRAALAEAVEKGQIGHETAARLLPNYREQVSDTPRLAGKTTPPSEALEQIESLKQLYGPMDEG